MNIPNRKDLISKLARRWKVREKVAAERIDGVLDEVLRVAQPRLENDWTGGEVLHQLLRWRGLRPDITTPRVALPGGSQSNPQSKE